MISKLSPETSALSKLPKLAWTFPHDYLNNILAVDNVLAALNLLAINNSPYFGCQVLDRDF